MKMLNFDEFPPSVQHYRHLRTCGRELTTQVLHAGSELGFDLLAAARRMGLSIERKMMVFNDSTEMDALMDFYLHDFRHGGRRLIDCYQPAECLSPDMQEVLTAHRTARSSIFEWVGFDFDSCTIYCRDLLQADQPVLSLTDIHLSQSAPEMGSLLIFTRVLTCQGISMTSGNSFIFHPQHRKELLRAFSAKVESVPQKARDESRFIFFCKRSRELGLAQGLVDVA